MALSNTYSFGKVTTVDDLLRNACLRIEKKPEEFAVEQVEDALFSLNLEISTWLGKRLSLWQVQRQMFQMYSGQATYQLPTSTVRVLDVTAISPLRLNAGGVPLGSSGAFANVFIPGNTSGCVQTAPNGYIGYNYSGRSPSIIYVGILAQEANQVYAIDVDYSFDGTNWETIYSAPSDSYPLTQLKWLVVEDALNAQWWRIREREGGTLKIQQLYFSQPSSTGVGDRKLGSFSREDYMNISNKNNASNEPSSYYFNQKLKCTITLWPVPLLTTPKTTAILYSSERYPMDINALNQNIDLPPMFFDPACAALAVRLATITPNFPPAKMQLLVLQSQEAYNLAGQTNFENSRIRISLNTEAYS
jgi:hypothetical protein